MIGYINIWFGVFFLLFRCRWNSFKSCLFFFLDGFVAEQKSLFLRIPRFRDVCFKRCLSFSHLILSCLTFITIFFFAKPNRKNTSRHTWAILSFIRWVQKIWHRSLWYHLLRSCDYRTIVKLRRTTQKIRWFRCFTKRWMLSFSKHVHSRMPPVREHFLSEHEQILF